MYHVTEQHASTKWSHLENNNNKKVSSIFVLWIEDTVIYETYPAFAIKTPQQLQKTGKSSQQAGKLPTLKATKDWTRVFCCRASAAFSLPQNFLMHENLVNKSQIWIALKNVPLEMTEWTACCKVKVGRLKVGRFYDSWSIVPVRVGNNQ